MPALTPKQTRFVEEYLQDLNATQAAIRAGYSERTANEQGAQLLKKPEIMAAIDTAKAERSEQTKVDAAWVLRRLVDEANADLADLYDKGTGELLPVEEWPLVWRQGLVQGVDVEELFDRRGADRKQIGTVRKIRLSDRLRRTELIGKHVLIGAFQELLKVDTFGGLTDRLARAHRRDGDPVQPIDPAPVAAPETLPDADTHLLHSRLSRASQREDKLPEIKSDWTEPPASPAPAVPEPYRPILPWPDDPGTAACDYDPT